MKPHPSLKEFQSTLDNQPTSKEQLLTTMNLCKMHKENFSMICLHTQCHSCYKLLCSKCKKQKHYQHPNRVVNLKDFYEMLGYNRLDFIENSLALTLVNIKTKLTYVSNFRVFILEKEAMLMENARTIHSTIQKILEEKMQLKSLLSNMNDQTQFENTEALIVSLQQIKKYISFNPIQNVIRINPQKVGYLKVQLQKHCESTKTVINDIRQYIVKIVQVMLEEEYEQEDIQYIEHQDVDEKVFNINVKKANHIEINEKQLRYKVQELKEMFDALLNLQIQKNEQHIENDVLKLQEEIKIKQQIVKNIRSRSLSKSLSSSHYSLNDQIKEISSPAKHSLTNSFIQSHSLQPFINSSKVNSPKTKDAIKDINAPKNVNRQNVMQSPKSPKMRSITDQVNTSPKALTAQNTSYKQSGFNKRTPQNNLKNNQKDLPKSDIKFRSHQQEKHIKGQKRESEEINELILEESQGEKIEESEEEQLLSTNSFNYEIRKTYTNKNVQSFKGKELNDHDFKEESLLLDRDSPEKAESQKFNLTKRIKDLETDNKKLKEGLSQKIKQINQLQKNHRLYKEDMEVKLHQLQQQLKDSLSKTKIDSIKQIKQTNNKFTPHYHHFPPTNKQKRTPQKQEDKLLKKANQNPMHTKKLMDQKKEFEGKIEKLQKQIKEFKDKETNYKKQHSMNVQTLKEVDKIKKKNQELIRKNEDLSKKSEQFLKKIQQTTKRNEQNARKIQEGAKRIEESNKKLEETNKKLEQANKKLEEGNKKLQSEKQKHQVEMKKKLSQLSRQVEKKIQSLQAKVKDLQQINCQLEEKSILLQKQCQQFRQLVEEQNSKTQEQKRQIQQQQTKMQQQENIIQEQDQLIKTLESISSSKANNIEEVLSKVQSELKQLKKEKAKLQKAIQDKQLQLEEKSVLLQEKDKTIASSQQKLTQQQQSMRQQDEIIQQQEISIKKQLIKIGDLEKTKTKLQSNLKNSQTLNQTNSTLIQQQNQNITQLQLIISQKQSQISLLSQLQQQYLHLKSTLQHKDKLNQQLELKYNQLQLQLEEVEEIQDKKIGQKIWTKDQEISQLQNKITQLQTNIKTLQSQNHQIQLQLNSIQSHLNQPSKQLKISHQNLTNLQIQFSSLKSKHQKLQDQYVKVKKSEAQQKKDHEKIQTEMLQQCQYLKKKYEQEKEKNQQTAQFDIKNYIPLIKYKELKEWYEIAMRKNQQHKEQISVLKEQKSQIISEYQNKLSKLQEQQKSLIQKVKTSFQAKYQSQETVNTETNNKQSSIQNEINAQNSPIMLTKYTQIRGIIEQITGDMQLLEQKVKENTVIEKVYLKELDRKRTENRKLRQEIEDYRNKERKLAGVKTDRYYEKTPSSKPKNDKPEYKVYYATGFAGSESKSSGTGSSLMPGNHYHHTQDPFTSSESPSTLSNNSNHLSNNSSKI